MPLVYIVLQYDIESLIDMQIFMTYDGAHQYCQYMMSDSGDKWTHEVYDVVQSGNIIKEEIWRNQTLDEIVLRTVRPRRE